MSKIRSNTDIEYDLAVRQGNARKIRTLIKNGAAPPNGMLLFALIRKHPELLALLKEAGAEPDDINGFNERALGRAVNEYQVEVVKTLLTLGADPNKESLHLLPLVWAAYDEKLEYVKTLINGGANPNLPQWNGVIPIHAAVRHGQYQVVKYLLECGADPKIKGPDGKNSIQLASLSKRSDLVDLLKSFPVKKTE